MKNLFLLFLSIIITGLSEAQVFELPPFVTSNLKDQIAFNDDSLIKRQGILTIAKFIHPVQLDEQINASTPEYIRNYNPEGHLIREQQFNDTGEVIFTYTHEIQGTNLVRITTRADDTTYKKTEIYNAQGKLVEDNCEMVPGYVACRNVYQNNRIKEKLEGNTQIIYDYNEQSGIETILVKYYGYLKEKSEVHYDDQGRKLKVLQYVVTPDGKPTEKKYPMESFIYEGGKLVKVFVYDEFAREVLKDSIVYTSFGKPEKHFLIGRGLVRFGYDDEKLSSIQVSRFNASSGGYITLEKWDYNYDSLKPEVPISISKSRLDKNTSELMPFEKTEYRITFDRKKMVGN